MGSEIKRYGLLMWSQGLCWVAINVALKYITQPNRSRWGSLPGGLQWRVRGGDIRERERKKYILMSGMEVGR